MACQAQRQGAQAAQAEEHLLRPRGLARQHMAGFELFVGLAVDRGGDAEHRVGMAPDIFCGGLDRQVDAMGQRLEIDRRRPAVVDHHGDAARLGQFGDRRHVLNLEAPGPWGFQIDHGGIGAEQGGDAGADFGIVELFQPRPLRCAR